MNSDIDYKQVVWKCRRGMVELDVVLRPFVKDHFSGLELPDQQRFIRLLEQPDPDLFNWLMSNGEPDDAELKSIVLIIQKAMGRI
ncbi:MAG: succinate dehydrogenase assembly factor 2 [Kangiellaceae bacterium]|jgi:antitoxin CptB|nr:succinate dehydrogenase assembly factor 2 [Kangiellaceae bacterium]